MSIVKINLVIITLNTIYLIKVANSIKQRKKIIQSITAYNKNRWENDDYINFINYDVIEDFYKTIFRLYDWSCKRIIPKTEYEKIEKYINTSLGE